MLKDIFTKQIVTYSTRKWAMVLLISLITFLGFESLSFLTGVYQIPTFLNVALVFYVWLIIKTSFVFDLRLKHQKPWSQTRHDLRHLEKRVLKELRILWTGIILRFRYLASWTHWRHFQNYLILPGVLYWAVVIMIFLHPFSTLAKQILAVIGSLLMAVVMWQLKTVFIHYDKASQAMRQLMYMTTVLTGFLIYTAALGICWYMGLPGDFFALTVTLMTFLLVYQSMFHRNLVNFSTLKYLLLASVLVGAVSLWAYEVWTVNFYTAGLLLVGVMHLTWGLSMQHLQKTLTRRVALEYLLAFALIVFIVLSSTNFLARVA